MESSPVGLVKERGQRRVRRARKEEGAGAYGFERVAIDLVACLATFMFMAVTGEWEGEESIIDPFIYLYLSYLPPVLSPFRSRQQPHLAPVHSLPQASKPYRSLVANYIGFCSKFSNQPTRCHPALLASSPRPS